MLLGGKTCALICVSRFWIIDSGEAHCYLPLGMFGLLIEVPVDYSAKFDGFICGDFCAGRV